MVRAVEIKSFAAVGVLAVFALLGNTSTAFFQASPSLRGGDGHASQQQLPQRNSFEDLERDAASESSSKSTSTGWCAATLALLAGSVLAVRASLRRHPVRQPAVAAVGPQALVGKAVPCFSAAPAPAAFSGGTLVKANPMRRGLSSSRTASLTARKAMMFERFTEKTIKAVMMGQAEARRLGQDHVSVDMLVVGIMAEGTDVGCRALAQVNLSLGALRLKIEELVGFANGGRSLEIPFTVEAKRVLEDSIECARDQGSPSVNTSHLLRAVLREESGHESKLLESLLKCNTEEVRNKLLKALTNEEHHDSAALGVQTKVGAAPVVEEVKLEETLKYAQDLTLMARSGELDPLVGRGKELKRTIRILGRRSKNNPVLLGEAGVGKTSIAHGLAAAIAEGKVPTSLRDKRVVQLDVALLLAGTRYRGDFEERLQAVVQEVKDSNRRVILVIDEVHTLVGAGSSGGAEGGGIDAANLLKPALARGELQCIGATTLDEYRQYIERDPALERRFQPVNVPEPTEEETVQILEGLASKYERHHQLRYTPEALVSAVKLASQYIADRYLPDKAIDVMDEAGSKVRQQIFQDVEANDSVTEQLNLNTELGQVRKDKKDAVAAERYDQAQLLKAKELELTDRLETLQSQAKKGPGSSTHRLLEELQALKAQILEAVCTERFSEAHDLKAREVEVLEKLAEADGGRPGGAAALAQRQVTAEDVAQVVSGWTGIEVEQVSAAESARLMRLEEDLQKSVIGQDAAVQSVSRAMRRARAGLRNPGRPIAGFMFCGPTGVGKTELCKTLSQTFFGSEDSMIRLDMSEYMEKHTVSKLVGSPPGYVGYSDGGTLTEAVRRRPYSLVLFDEVEKAHPDVFNMMLQVLDDGRLTDSKGRTVSFANALVVMTSNLGSRSVQKGASGGLGLGFETAEEGADTSYAKMKELVHEEMKSFFRPEFLNRLDELVVFRSLTRENVRAIAEVEFKKVLGRLKEQDLDVTLTQAFKNLVLEEGFDPAYGARPLRRAITRRLEDSLAEHILMVTEQEAPATADVAPTGALDREGAPAGTAAAPAAQGEVPELPLRRSLQVDVDHTGKVVVRCGSKVLTDA